MTKKSMRIAGWAALGCLIALGAGCKEDNPITPPPKEPLELLYPIGGESLMAGSTVVISWQINDTNKVVGVVINLSLNNGMTFDTLINKGGSVFPPQTTFTWTTAAGHVSTQCVIRIRDYNDYAVTDKSGAFTVHN